MRFFYLLLVVLFFNCREQRVSLFTEVSHESGVDFINSLQSTEEMNPYTYRSFYNGGGVAIGDINNDDLVDLYFTGNQSGNKLFLNKGNLKFQDITNGAMVGCAGAWSTGATLVDINADGLLDIYVCKSGSPNSSDRHNSLFINNGDLTFTDKAQAYGLDVKGLSVQAAFFDYDKDGDLDCYLLTNSIKSIGSFDVVKDLRKEPDPTGGGNKFFKNTGNKFVDYSAEAGIYRSVIGFGLGITLGDFNEDNWVDIFLSNDFFERDYLYVNNKNGGFEESLENYFESISMGSMGADYADLNNDGSPELFVTEMLPENLSRRKSKTVYDNWNKYQWNLKNGYHHQFSRNVLQTRVSNGQYMEIGRLAGVAATEWSWGALLFDMDNDGFRDIFVANGIYKDLLDRDYLAYTSNKDVVREIIKKEKNPILKLIEMMPASQFNNYSFRNSKNFQFADKSREWGFTQASYSTGGAYGDLDNDGDLDLVINNINQNAFLYKNNSAPSDIGFLEFDFTGCDQNTKCIGTYVKVYSNGSMYVGENYLSRGFQSSVSSRIHLAFPKTDLIDSIEVAWPDFADTTLYKTRPNQLVKVIRNKSLKTKLENHSETKRLGIRLRSIEGSFFKHAGNSFVDFDRERLLPMSYGNEGPGISKGDVNGDSIEEIYVGGGINQSGVLLKHANGKFNQDSQVVIQRESAVGEETRSLFFDADNDGDDDLYLAFGGTFHEDKSNNLRDVILLNDGKGAFKDKVVLPFQDGFATSVVRPIDFDNDGDLDLVVGERFNPRTYGTGGRAYLLGNDGNGLFKDISDEKAPVLKELGMVTDIAISDFDRDGLLDMVVVGDWTGIKFIRNEGKQFIDVTSRYELGDTQGWWHSIETADLNKDGYPDYVLGNLGLNSFFKPDDMLYISDFDGNGFIEQVYCSRIEGLDYPVLEKDELIGQLPYLRKQLLYYNDYSVKPIDQIFNAGQLANSKQLYLKETRTMALISNQGKYGKLPLPGEAQFAPVYAVLLDDLNADGVVDVLLGGNQYKVKPQFGRLDASSGWFFKGNFDQGNFSFSSGQALGVRGEIRDIEKILIDGKTFIFFAINNEPLQIFELER